MELNEYVKKLARPERRAMPPLEDKHLNGMITIRSAICPGFVSDNDVDEFYLNGLKYFHRDGSSAWDINKGLYIYGVFGVGKTLFFKVFREYLLVLQAAYYMVSSDDLSSEFARYGFEGLEKYYGSPKNVNISVINSDIFIDDVGQGANSVKFYGSSTNVIVEVLQRRYRRFTDGNSYTHISTNIEPKEIKEIYGEYIHSRAKEMFNPVLFPGKDKRK